VKIVRALLADGRQRLMTSSNATRDALFRKARVAAKIDNLHFHDSRAEAIWRLSKKLDPLELARQIGHRDPKSLLLYYEADAAEMARKLDA
jgi:integrase